MSGQPRASVVVPAHNEADKIVDTLSALLSDAEPGEFDVIVVCNGCTDSTAELARHVAGVRAVELPEPSKIAALREGDQRTDVFPRIYLDGDVLLSTDTARALAEALSGGEALAAGVPGRYDLEGAPLSVQLYYEFRQSLPVFADGIIGAGAYAMSAAGRQRFGEWPEVIADDQFVYRLFRFDEIASLRTHHTVVQPVPSLRAVVRRGVRVRHGNAALTAGEGDAPPLPPPKAGLRKALRGSARSLRAISGAAVFVGVSLTVRVRSLLHLRGDWPTVPDAS